MKIIAMENEFTIFTISSEESADEKSFILFSFSIFIFILSEFISYLYSEVNNC